MTAKDCLDVHKLCDHRWWSLCFQAAEVIFVSLEGALERWAAMSRDNPLSIPLKIGSCFGKSKSSIDVSTGRIHANLCRYVQMSSARLFRVKPLSGFF